MARPTLATIDGEQIGIAFPPRRYVEHAGTIVDRRNGDRALSIAEANAEFGRLSRTMIAAEQAGDPIHRALAWEASSLFAAIRTAETKKPVRGFAAFRSFL